MADTLRVLYVDDEPPHLDIGKLFLEESGDFTVTTAISAPEGFQQLKQEQFDAIISLCQMPGIDASGSLLRCGHASGRTGIISDEVQGPI
ncbi:MAG: hypothetical protein WCK53_14170 [Methanomicrobiales archaeon]